MPCSCEPIWVAKRILWDSPPLRDLEGLLKDKYDNPTFIKKEIRSSISFNIPAAICVSFLSSLAGIFLNTYKSSSRYKGIFQIDESVKEIPIQSDIHGFFFIKLGYLTGSIFQKSTINSINPTDAENVLSESYSDETGETEIYANPKEPMQIAIPIVPERGGSHKKRLCKRKSKTRKNKRI